MKLKRQRKPDVMDELGGLISLLADVPSIVAEGDRRKLSVFIDQIEQEWPDVYLFCADQVDKLPSAVLAALCERWPKFGFLKLYPAHLAIIGVIQAEIKERRGNARQN